MPQMYPLLWMTLYIYFIFIFIIFIMMNYFNFYTYIKKNNFNSMKLTYSTLKSNTWKW